MVSYLRQAAPRDLFRKKPRGAVFPSEKQTARRFVLYRRKYKDERKIKRALGNPKALDISGGAEAI